MEQYIKLNATSKSRLLLTGIAKSPHTNWRRKNAFDIASVPVTALSSEPIIGLIREFNGVPIIFRMQPWQFYRFHVDAARSCAINLFLEGVDSETYYGVGTADEEILNITELRYERDRYYLLNTKQKHCVINRDNVRYMFSVGFPDTVNYETVRDFCLENKL